jgi:hypothetical protein
MALLESIGDPAMTVGLSFVAFANWFNSGDFREILRWSQTAINLAAGNPVLGAGFGFGSPLAMALTFRGIARFWLGHDGWRQDFADAMTMARNSDPSSAGLVIGWQLTAVLYGVIRHDDSLLRQLEEAMERADEFGNGFARTGSHLGLGTALLYRDDIADRRRGLELLTRARDVELPAHAPSLIPVAQVRIAKEKVRSGECSEGISMMRRAVGELREANRLGWDVCHTADFVETLLERGGDDDLAEAQTEIERLADAQRRDPSAVLDITLLRLQALMARARRDDVGYQDLVYRYRTMAKSLDFDGHIASAEAMAQ